MPVPTEPGAPAARTRFETRIRRLAAFGHRGSATDREREAADWLAGELRGMGLSPEAEPFAGRRSLGGRLLLHVAVAAAGAAVAWVAPVATVALGALALGSLVYEQMTWGLLLSRLLPARPSANVTARVPPPAGGPVRRRVVVCAHYDTAQTGRVWRGATDRGRGWVDRRLPVGLKPPCLPLAGFMLLQIAAGVVGLAGAGWVIGAVAGGVAVVAYAAAGFLLGDWARGASVPGAADNASGVAAVLGVAEGWAADPPAADAEGVVVLTGCEESGLLGAMAWARRHRAEAADVPTVFLNVDGVGFGPPRFLGWEVPVAGVPLRYPADLLGLCRQVAAERGLADAGPHTVPGPTDGLALLAAGLRGVTVVGFADGGRLPHYHLPTDDAEHMDFDAAWAGASFAAAIARRMASPADRPGS